MSVKQQVSGEEIGAFLEGRDPQKYIVAIEAAYFQNTVSLIINDPVKGKYIQKVSYKPFLWLKHEMASIMYGGERNEISTATKKFNIKISALKTDNNGVTPKRMENGYKYIAKCDGSYTDLLNFFKEGGVDVFDPNFKEYFMTCSPTEQFLIQTGKRLFKGFEEYDELHRFQFDLETTGLFHSQNSIFQIGMKDNRGFEKVIEVKVPDLIQDALNDIENDPSSATADQLLRLKSLAGKELRDSEREAIKEFFDTVHEINPDIIAGYNSENFDWDFFFGRGDILSLKIDEIAKTLNPKIKIHRKDSQLKLGGNVEHYKQTCIWGTNVIDVMHSVRRAQAINSDIKKAGLKYITKFSKIAKPNRIYIDGSMIHKTWADRKNKYYLNDSNGDWFKYDENNEEHAGKITNTEEGNVYVETTGDEIVRRYLIDDLWETEQVDARFNQATFLLGKLIPTSYMRSSTMGTAGIWKLIMMAWSYENNLAIPELQPQETFPGGLSRLLEVGYARNVGKLDYAALYPKEQLTHDIFPEHDISGVMMGLLNYIVETRDSSKELKGIHEENAEALKKEIIENKETYSPTKLKNLEAKRQSELGLADKFDKKQLPVKILANSFFGSFGAPHLFPWGDIDCAAEITCRGRQYLRLMVRNFYGNHKMRPLVGDTDGYNFNLPDSLEEFKYTPKGTHSLTKKYKGIEINGLNAAVAKFNEELMFGKMGLDIDAKYNSTINFARKNYANNLNGKIKLVGNTIKSKKMPIYIEEFLDKAIKMLLDGNGYEFIETYHKTVQTIINYEVPLVKIASKSSIRKTISAYKAGFSKKNKAGNPMPRQAHMELALKEGLELNLGDIIYYVNIGTTKTQGDIKTIKKPGGGVEVELMCKLIPTEQIEDNPNLTTDEYNAPKYLAAFNKRIKPLLVCFTPEIRNRILIDYKKNSKTKQMELIDREFFTRKDCELCSGQPFLESDQDTYEALMTFEDKELAFWTRVNKVPNNIDENEWEIIKSEYLERVAKDRIEGIANEKLLIDDRIKRLEISEIEDFRELGVLPKSLTMLLYVDSINDETVLLSDKYGKDVFYQLEDLFSYENDAIERDEFYMSNSTENLTYDDWLTSKGETTVYEEELTPISNLTIEETKLKRAEFYNLYPNLKLNNNDWFELCERLYDEDGEAEFYYNENESKLNNLAKVLNINGIDLIYSIGNKLKITSNDLEGNIGKKITGYGSLINVVEIDDYEDMGNKAENNNEIIVDEKLGIDSQAELIKALNLELLEGNKPLFSNTYKENGRHYTSERISYLEENEVFVFGSNPLGINGNPEKYPNMSASVATANGWVGQGEIMDNRLSNCGKAWGITTVTKPGAKLSKTPNEIGKGIQDMVLYAKKRPHLKFLVTKFGTENAGHSIEVIKTLFEKLEKFIPDNVILPKEFEVRD